MFTKEELAPFLEKSDSLAWFHLGLRLLFHLSLLTMMGISISAGQWLLAGCFFYLNAMAWHFFGYAGIGHELYHKTAFTSKRVNMFLYFAFSYITWNNPAYFSQSHWTHHLKTFRDEDVEIYEQLPSPIERFLRFFIFDYVVFPKKILYAIFNSLGFEVYFHSRFITLKRIEKRQQEIVGHARNVVVTNITFVLLMNLAFGPVAALLLLMTPFTGSFLNIALALSQHVGLSGQAETGALFHARTIVLAKPLALLYANMNYHGEHHLLPSVPYYRLPDFYARINEKNIDRLDATDIRFLFSDDFRTEVKSLAQARLA